MKNSKLINRGILDSLGAVVYIFLVSFALNNAEKLLGPVDNKLLAPVIFLLTFIFSALLTGFLILGKPLMLYLDGAKKESLKLLFYTGLSLFVLLLLAVLLYLIVR